MNQEELDKSRRMAEWWLDAAGFDAATVKRLDEIGFFTAPASKDHHLAEPGGLMRHSANVTQWLEKLTHTVGVEWPRRESPYIVGMLHDLVKCKCYEVDKALSGSGFTAYRRVIPVYPGHGVASALIAMSDLGLSLDPIEVAAISHHMGAFGLDERQLKEYDAALDRWPREIIATHTADILAARVDEGGKF